MNWDVCVEQLASELTAEAVKHMDKPLQVEESAQSIYLFAPNRFVKDWVADRYLDRIQSFYSRMWVALSTFQSGWVYSNATGRSQVWQGWPLSPRKGRSTRKRFSDAGS